MMGLSPPDHWLETAGGRYKPSSRIASKGELSFPCNLLQTISGLGGLVIIPEVPRNRFSLWFQEKILLDELAAAKNSMKYKASSKKLKNEL